MKDFGRWLASQAPIPADPPEQVTPDFIDMLPDGVYDDQDGKLYAHCKACDNRYELACAAEDFNPEYSYCGGSPSCCP